MHTERSFHPIADLGDETPLGHGHHPCCSNAIEILLLQHTAVLNAMASTSARIQPLRLLVGLQHRGDSAVTDRVCAHLPIRTVRIDDEGAQHIGIGLEETAVAFTAGAIAGERIEHRCGPTDQRPVREDLRAADPQPLIAEARVNAAVECEQRFLTLGMVDVTQRFNRHQQVRPNTEHTAPTSLHPCGDLHGRMSHETRSHSGLGRRCNALRQVPARCLIERVHDAINPDRIHEVTHHRLCLLHDEAVPLPVGIDPHLPARRHRCVTDHVEHRGIHRAHMP